jgi:triphosphoribosyl-dephospho-CoA synthase
MNIAQAFVDACLAEIEALKPGNVHRHAAGHGMTVGDFISSAEAAAPAIAAEGAGVGERIWHAVEATRAAVGQNTNLGIVLLAAPLAAAAELGAPLWPAVGEVLDRLTVADARLAYRAVRLASPGGLGSAASADVADEPRITLLAAMRLAADRDRIAWNYAHGFTDLRRIGLPALTARGSRMDECWAVTGVYLRYLSVLSDSHIARKLGPACADAVRLRAVGLYERFASAETPASLERELLAFDVELKAAGINPGTSADLTVATLFAHRLAPALPNP